MRIALCQINPTVGALDENAQLIELAAAAAAERGAELALLPEQSICGYPAEDLLLKEHFVERCEERVAALASRLPIPAVVGCPERHGSQIHNAAMLVGLTGRPRVYRKWSLPNYGVFDERRHFSPGSNVLVVEFKGVRVGVTICEDIWLDAGPLVATVGAGAKVILNLSASPYSLRRLVTRRKLVAGRAREHDVPILYCNLVGGQDELVFDGGSIVVDAGGELVALAPQFETATLLVDVTPSGVLTPVDSSTPPIAVVPTGLEEVYGALGRGLRDYVDKNGFSTVLVAVSGGIDSALVLALAVDTLGVERVRAVTLPSAVTSSETLADARLIAERLGVHLDEIPIENIVDSFRAALAPPLGATPDGVTLENLQARVRGSVAMALSNMLGHLVLATGNKSEASVGYMTLYGDMAGGFAPIKDVFKTRVYELCRWLNQRVGEERIPVSIIDRPPSAELRAGQRDEDTLPPYELLDSILERYVERDLGIDAIVAEGFDEQVVREVAHLVDRAEYKRRQAPPGIKIGPKAFGRDRRLPITNHFRE